MARGRKKKSREDRLMGLGEFFNGLGSFIEKLGELSEQGEELHKTGEIRGPDDRLRGIFGFNVKVGLGDEGLKVEPFGNVRKDEVRQPMVDVFDEGDHVLVVAEMPGVGEEDLQLELKDDVLIIAAERGEMKYRKEVLLPDTFSAGQMSHSCRNGVLEVKLARQTPREG
jgi:HSP20 family protein